MEFIEAKLKGLCIINPKVFHDARGCFFESYNQRIFAEHGIQDAFVQDNMSRSVRGTLRGLHYQLNPHAQGKLVRVTQGAVFDVAVDIRRGSPTYGQWFGETLSAENRRILYIPPGFAHGFIAITAEAEFHYKVTNFWVAQAERSLLWSDPAIGIQWPLAPDPGLLSQKDREAPPLNQAENNFI